jgi:undecaprenyl-diphosphatase
MIRVGEWVEEARRELPASIVPNWIVVILLAIVLPLSFVAAGTSVLPGDVALTRFVQGNLPGVLEPMVAAGNLIGSSPAMISIALVVTIGLLSRGHRQPALLVAGATLAQAANVALKLTLESPRPTSSLVQVSEQASGFGFPSGHTMGTTALALVLLYVATKLMAAGVKRRLVQSMMLFVPLMTGIARIETGAHWPSDVLGAWIWGTLAAIAVVTLAQRSWNRFSLPVARPARSIKNTIAIGDMSGD